MVHEWRHLMMLKRAGRGHDETGVAGTQEGECAVLCPACPQPGKNMDFDWKTRPAHLRWVIDRSSRILTSHSCVLTRVDFLTLYLYPLMRIFGSNEKMYQIM